MAHKAAIGCLLQQLAANKQLMAPAGYLGSIRQYIVRRLTLTTRQGAQASLYSVLAEGVKGLTCYNNVFAVVPSTKLMCDKAKAAAICKPSQRLAKDLR